MAGSATMFYAEPINSGLRVHMKKKRSCNCKNSRCTKLYCECFAAGVYCNDTCNCANCCNNKVSVEATLIALTSSARSRWFCTARPMNKFAPRPSKQPLSATRLRFAQRLQAGVFGGVVGLSTSCESHVDAAWQWREKTQQGVQLSQVRLLEEVLRMLPSRDFLQ